MADKSFGVKELNLISASGTPTITSPNSVNINATNVAISTDITVGGMVSLGAGTSISSPGNNVLTFGTNSTEKVRILSNGRVAIGGVTANSLLDVHGGDGISITSSGDTFLQSRTTGTTGTNYLEFKDSGGGSGAISYHHDGNSMRFKTAGSERARITDVGDVLLGGLTSKNDGRNAKGITLKSPAGISFQNYGSNGSRNWRIRPDDLTSWGSLEFSVSPTDNNNTDWPDAADDVVLELKKDKNVVVSNGNLVIGTSGQGIDFSANSNASGMSSELLDDYEEGTWTPTIRFGSSAFNGSYVVNEGFYTKVGRLVSVSCELAISSKGSTTGTVNIAGLPFTPNSDDESRASGVVGYYQDVSNVDFPIVILVEPNQTEFPLRDSGTASATGINNGNVGNGFRFYFTITYMT